MNEYFWWRKWEGLCYSIDTHIDAHHLYVWMILCFVQPLLRPILPTHCGTEIVAHLRFAVTSSAVRRWVSDWYFPWYPSERMFSYSYFYAFYLDEHSLSYRLSYVMWWLVEGSTHDDRETSQALVLFDVNDDERFTTVTFTYFCNCANAKSLWFCKSLKWILLWVFIRIHWLNCCCLANCSIVLHSTLMVWSFLFASEKVTIIFDCVLFIYF